MAQCLDSSQKPPRASFLKLLREQLLEYSALPLRQNVSYWDLRAQSWLSRHREIMIVDADKNLGDVLILRSDIVSACRKLVHESYDSVTREEASACVEKCKKQLAAILDSCRADSIPTADKRGLQAVFSKTGLGTFRCLVKLHKTPIKFRPISNLGPSWCNSLAIWCCSVLREVQDKLPWIVTNTQQVLHKLKYLRIPDDYVLATIDVTNLYPSVIHKHLFQQLRSRIIEYGADSVAKIAVDILLVVFQGSLIEFEGHSWQPRQGIPTGTSPGVVVANVYLDGLDKWLVSAGLRVLEYMRFVDDTLLVIHRADVSRALSVLNSWHPSIQFETVAVGREGIPYLDLNLSIVGDTIAYQTHRKEQNGYLYLPRGSCHPSGVFGGLVKGEAIRLRRTNDTAAKYQEALRFFEQKLSQRGYSISWIRQVASSSSQVRKRGEVATTTRKAFLKVTWSSALNERFLRMCLARNGAVLSQAIGPHSFVLAKAVQRNLFRLRYGQWRM